MTSKNIDLDRKAPTCSLSKSDNKSTSGISATFSRHDTQPYDANTTLSGLDSSKTDAAQKYENLKTGRDNSKTYTYKATDHAGNSCSKSVTVKRYLEKTTCHTWSECTSASCCGEKTDSYNLNVGCSARGPSGNPQCKSGYKMGDCWQMGGCYCECYKKTPKTCRKPCCNSCNVWNTVTKYKYD